MAHEASAARVASMRSLATALPRWNGEPLMLTTTSAPAAACSEMGPNGTHESSQMDSPTTTPLISTRGSRPSPGTKYRFSSKTV